MKRMRSIASLLIILAIVLLSACNQKSDVISLTLSDNDASTNENYFGLINNYSCGFIAENEPLKISFNSDVKLKKNNGEELTNNVFTISPKIKGSAYWIDNHTIGYRFDASPKPNLKYNVSFNVGQFIDVPKNCEMLDFIFIIKPQNFNITNILYSAKSNNICSYSFDVNFTNPIESDKVINLLDKKILNQYDVSSSALSNNTVRLNINDIERSNQKQNLTVIFNGKSININNKISVDIEIPSSNDLNIVRYNILKDENAINIQFSNPLQKNQNLAGLIEFSNKLEYKTDISDNQLIIYFDKDSYTNKDLSITIYPYINDIYDNSTYDSYAIKDISINKIKPETKWKEDGVIIPDIDNTSILFDAKALKSVTVRFIKIYDNNILSFIQNNDIDDTWNVRKVGRLIKKAKIVLNTTNYDEWKTYSIKLSDYINVKPGDMYQLSINFDINDAACDCTNQTNNNNNSNNNNETKYWDNLANSYKTYYYEDNWWQHYNDPCSPSFYNDVEIKKNILVSNIAITAKSAFEKNIDVFVRNINDATPSNNTTVTAYNYQLQEINKAKTDNNGYCHIFCENEPYIITAQDAKGSKSFLQVEKSQSLSLSKFDISGNNIENNINGFIYSNRDLWRPGDSININFMLFDKDKKLPANFPVIMELYDAQNRLYNKKINNSPIGNIYSFTNITDVNDETGTWMVYIKLGNTSFSKSLRIETIKPNRLEINFKVPEMIYLSENKPILLKSQWLNGIKASNLSASVDVLLRPCTAEFSQFKEYTFENEAQNSYSTEYSIFSSTLDADGIRKISMEPLKSNNITSFTNAQFTIKVFEQSGDFSITTRNTKISHCERYIGVCLPETPSKYGDYYFTERDWKFPIAVVNEKGNIENKDIKLDYYIYKLDSYWWWSYDTESLSSYISGTYNKPVKSGYLYCTNGKTNIELNIKDADWGAYFLVIKDEVSGSVFSKIIYFDSEYYSRSSSLSNAPAIIQLNSDKSAYSVGEKVNITFPANKTSTAIVTVESASKVIETLNLNNLSENSSVSFTVTEDMAPNIYVYISLLQPYNSDNNLPIRMYGILPLKIESKNSTLEPIINMPEQSNSNTTIDIKVSEKNNKEMYYTLALVDEGILGITSYKTADPYGYFYSKQALNIRTWDNYKYIIDSYTGEMLSVFAIGGDMSIIPPETTLSKRFSAVAYSLGPFKLEAGETATHSVKIPEYLGALRAMVVASDCKNAFGSTQKNIKIKNPLMLMNSAPRVVSPGDKFVLNIQTISPDNPNNKVNLNISGKNINVVDKNLTVNLDKTGDGNATCNIEIPNVSGIAEINIKGSIDSYNTSSKIQIPIRTPFTPKHNLVTEEIKPNQSYDFNVNVNGIKGTEIGKVTINTLLPLDISSRIEFLNSYPYSCLEQSISSAFPRLYLDALTELDEQTKQESKNMIEAAITKINSYLRNDYSLTFWKGGKYVEPWTEIYAAHFLVEAKKLGYNVTDNIINGIIKYQKNKATSWRYNSDHPYDDVIQAYRLFVLALNNDAATGAMNKLNNLDSLQILSKAILAASYSLIGKNKVAQELIPTIDYTTEKQLSEYYVSYGSKVRDVAFCTYAEMLCGSDNMYIKKLIDNIAYSLNNNDWMSTQTTAFSLFVIEQYAKQKGFKNSPIDVTVNINGNSNNISTNMFSSTLNFSPNNSNSIKVSNRSENPIYASVFTKYLSPEYNYTDEIGSGYKMSVTYYNKEGLLINPEVLTRNTDFYASITIINTSDNKTIKENALTYLIPAGWEIVNDRLLNNNSENEYKCNHIDIRDDRVSFFFELIPGQKKTFEISLNATYKGNYTIPPVICEDMYDNNNYYTIPAKKVTVK